MGTNVSLNTFVSSIVSSSFSFSYLLCGDFPSADAMFKQQEPKTKVETVHKLIDKGLVAVAQNDYEEAFQQFQKAHEIDKDNILVSLICETLRY